MFMDGELKVLLHQHLLATTIGYSGTDKKRFPKPNILSPIHLSPVIMDRPFHYQLMEQHYMIFLRILT